MKCVQMLDFQMFRFSDEKKEYPDKCSSDMEKSVIEKGA